MRQSVLFVHQHGKVLLAYLVLCLVLGAVMARPAGALVEVGIVEGLRKDIRDLNLLNRPSAQNGNQDKPASSPSAPANATPSQRPQPVSSTSKAGSASAERGEYAGSVGYVDPLPVVDTSPMPYPSLTVTPFGSGSVKAASVVSAAPPITSDTSSRAAIEASPQGWHVAGVAWYWWLLSLLAVGLGIQQYFRWKKQVSLAGASK